ncbi:putative HVA22-like protein g [Tasmannia lanceolata]|uniref:putative HVA22-like protein g n=1 Tax=Tasmannia lanceolata TaxID=3420 RepID=UPI0040629C38
MLGDFIIRVLVMFLGYVYPAFECFKTVEKNRADVEQLRFWCQYWIIVAVLTVFERIGDIFVSWLPMYGELKLAFFVYLWYPKTKGTTYVYESLLQPFIAKYETEIDRTFLELRTRAWDMAILYWKNFSSQGQVKFYEILHYLASQSPRHTTNQMDEAQQQKAPTPEAKTVIHRHSEKQIQKPPMLLNRAVFQAQKADQNG